MSGDNLTQSTLKIQSCLILSQHYQYFLPVDGATLHLYQATIWFEAKHLQR